MVNTLIQTIEVEIAQLDLLLITYADLLVRIRRQPPDVVELAALATVLHSFYSGAEGVFLTIARQLDRYVPDEPRWHRVLLTQMARPHSLRPPVISPVLEARLTDYLAFRHYFRHAYAFTLDWARLEPLVQGLASMHTALRDELTVFLHTLATQPGSA